MLIELSALNEPPPRVNQARHCITCRALYFGPTCHRCAEKKALDEKAALDRLGGYA